MCSGSDPAEAPLQGNGTSASGEGTWGNLTQKKTTYREGRGPDLRLLPCSSLTCAMHWLDWNKVENY